jgi:hypothetical protein
MVESGHLLVIKSARKFMSGTDTRTWVDISTIVAATAALWALGFAWVTYAMSVKQQKEDDFLAFKKYLKWTASRTRSDETMVGCRGIRVFEDYLAGHRTA